MNIEISLFDIDWRKAGFVQMRSITSLAVTNLQNSDGVSASRNTVELVDALGYIVVHTEIKIVALYLLVLLLRKPVNPVARLTSPALLYHLPSQCHSLGVDALVIEGKVDGTLDLLDAPDEETAVLVIIDDMNLIARGTEPRIVLQDAVPLGIKGFAC